MNLPIQVKPTVAAFQWPILFLLFLTTSAWAKDVRLENIPTAIFGPLQVRLAFTDLNGKAQDVPLQQLSPAALSSLPPQFQQAATSVLFNGKTASSYFDQLWAGSSAAVCGEISSEVGANISTTGHSAYDINCTPNPQGLLTAWIATEWEDEYWAHVKGHRLILDYWIPSNYATFYVSTGCTHHRGSDVLVSAEDPQFTLIFDVHLVLFFISNPIFPNSITLPFTETHGSSVEVGEVLQGDYGAAVDAAAKKWATDIDESMAFAAAGIGDFGLDEVEQSTIKLLGDLGGIAAAAICNEHLRDTVSASLMLGSGTVGSDSLTLAQQFDRLFQNLLAGYSAGFSQFDVVGDSNSSLILRWTAPPVSKPVLENLGEKVNNTPSLFAPTIGADRTQVAAGNQLTVRGNYFDGAYTTGLRIGWTQPALPGQPKTAKLDWGEKNQSVHVETFQSSFEANGLTPGTTYQFRVTVCTPIACTPTSDWFYTATQGQGVDKVVLYLDTPAQVIGNATLGGDGTFTASVTIPKNATPGPHVIYASVGGTGPLGGPIKFMRRTVDKGITAAPRPARPAPIPSTNANAPSLLPPVKVLGVSSSLIGKVAAVPMGGGQQALVTITVCGAGGCGPSIAHINPDTNMAYAGGGRFLGGLPFILEGENFAPNQAVGLYLDAPSGQVIGTASVNSKGSFQSSFPMPYVSGNHTLVAIEGTGKNGNQAKLAIFVQYAPQ